MKRFFNKPIRLFLLALLVAVSSLGAALHSYTGPQNRTRTETGQACVYMLRYCTFRNDRWVWNAEESWSCGNQYEPWLAHPPLAGRVCDAHNNVGDYGYQQEYVVTEITTILPPAEISAQPVCSLAGQNGWCRGGSGLQLTGHEPVSGYNIFALGVVQNGASFVVENTAAALIPALEGHNDFEYWAYSTWGDTSLMGTTTLYLDSQAPQVTASSLTGTPGENGWYVSAVDISVSFADLTPGSGLDRIDVLLNGGAPQPFVSPLTLTDGQHDVRLQAFDAAGNLTELSQTVLVDTVAPQVQVSLDGTLAEGWYVKTASLSASAVDPDPASGLAALDVSLNGNAWTPYTAALVIGHGQHQAVFRARDVAGNLTVSAPLPFQVDAKGPRIDLPEGWKIWETAAFVVRDSESGLGGIEVIISDPQGRWPPVKRAYEPSGGRYEGQISWNRRFADDTLAPVGSYRVTVKASDLAGNFSQKQATLSIPAVEAPAEEGTVIIVQPVVEAEEPPLETVFALPPEEPKVAPAVVETVFGAPSLAVINEAWQANSLSTVPPLAEPDGIVWGAGALAAMAGMSAYYLSKRREEEEAQRRAVQAQVAAKNAALRAKEAQMREQAKIQNYLQGKAMLEAQLKNSGLSQAEQKKIKEHAKTNGMEAGMKKTMLSLSNLFAPSSRIREKKDDVSPDGVIIPPLSNKQYVDLTNLNAAAQVGVMGITTGAGILFGAVIGFLLSGPLGGSFTLPGAVIGGAIGAMWGGYEVSCLTSVQRQFDKAYQQSGSIQVWHDSLWAYNVSGGGDTYAHANGLLSGPYVYITTGILAGKFP
jgi:hypothetical protein